jgi:hypothetical protein
MRGNAIKIVEERDQHGMTMWPNYEVSSTN